MSARKLKDEELSKIEGGSFFKRNHTWSDDPPHRLIVTIGYSCPLFSGPSDRKKVCHNCSHLNISPTGLVLYCLARTYDNDPAENYQTWHTTSMRF